METKTKRERVVSWWSASLCWFAFGVVNGIQTVFIMRHEGMHHDWGRLFATTVLSWLPWAVSTNAILHLGQVFPPFSLRRPRFWAVHVLGCLTMVLLYATWKAWLEMLFNPYAVSKEQASFGHNWFDVFSDSLLASLLLYVIVLVAAHALSSQLELKNQQIESAELSEKATEAQLAALRSQIEPHFLFNSLNAAVGLVRSGQSDAAASMITELCDFLRHTLNGSSKQEITLGEELEFVCKYLTIQKVRFGDRLQFSMDVPAGLNEVRVPSLILQPIVENAVKHGIAHRAKGGSIQISAVSEEDMLRIVVLNDGPPMKESFEDGTGLSNVRDRLQALYGSRSELTLRSREAGGAEASLALPHSCRPEATQG